MPSKVGTPLLAAAGPLRGAGWPGGMSDGAAVGAARHVDDRTHEGKVRPRAPGREALDLSPRLSRGGRGWGREGFVMITRLP